MNDDYPDPNDPAAQAREDETPAPDLPAQEIFPDVPEYAGPWLPETDRSRTAGLGQWINILFIAAAVVLLTMDPFPKVTRRQPGEETAWSDESSSPERRGMNRRLAELQELAESLESLEGDDLVGEIAKDPRRLIGLIGFGLFVLAIMGVAVAGLVLCGWFLVCLKRRHPIIAQAKMIEANWTLLDALTAISILLVTVGVLLAILPRGEIQPLIAALIGYGLAYLFGRHVVRKRWDQSLDAAGVRFSAFWPDVGRGIMGYATALPLFGMVAYINLRIWQEFSEGGSTPAQSPLITLLNTDSPSVILGFVVLIVVVGPLVEEFLFRGLLFGALRRRLSAKWTIFLTAIIFALIHRSLFLVPQLFILGLFLGYLYEKTRSLVATSILHIIQNTVAVTLILLIRLAT